MIAPDWGGVVDFLYAPDDKGKKKAHFLKVDYDLKPVQEEAVWEPVLIRDSLWAFPKRFSYVSRLRDVVKMHGIYHAKAKRLRKWLLKEFEKGEKYNQFLKLGNVNNAFDSISMEEVDLLLEGII